MEDLRIVDLHTHTNSSDGSDSPEGLMWKAREKGLAAIAVTDHDTMDAVEFLLEKYGGYYNILDTFGVELIPGVEISTDYSGEMHILGYFCDFKKKEFRQFLNKLRRAREERNPKVLEKLRSFGIEITMDEVIDAAGDGAGVVGRPHIARAMMKKGYVNSIAEAFERYLGEGKPAYVRKERIPPEKGISEIISSGGIPVLAHPGLIMADPKTGRKRFTEEELDYVIGWLKDHGLKGIEVFYTTHTSNQVDFFMNLAKRYKLLITGGSDYHGSTKPDIDLGTGYGSLCVPYGLLKGIKEYAGMPAE